MLDPIPPAPEWLQSLVRPLSNHLSLPMLPYHIHEVLFFFILYQFIQSIVSPWLSTRLFPKIYPTFNRRNKLNWDIHIVSLVQSVLVNAVALWVMFVDEERKGMTGPGERVLGYTGACGLVQSMAVGYFVWDLIVSTLHIGDFGIGLFLHAVSALTVYMFGFRPFVVSYSPVFILYELSTPFLNMHWFFDKVNMTGSRAQWYNGMMLLGVFFSCRLIWGIWQSALVLKDIFEVLSWTRALPSTMAPHEVQAAIFSDKDISLCLDETCIRAATQVSAFATHINKDSVPVWLALIYLVSNTILNSLNVYWFSKMIDAVMKRFRVPKNGKQAKPAGTVDKKRNNIVLEAAATLEEEEENLLMNGSGNGVSGVNGARAPNGHAGARRRKA